MDRGACQATTQGITKVRHNLATETPFDFDYNTFVIWLKIRRCDASSFFLFLKVALTIQDFFFCCCCSKQYLELFILVL